MRSFASDNNSGISNEIIDAIIKANVDHAVGYGDDKWSREAEALINKTFGGNADVLFTFNGTGSNCVALQLCTKSYGLILCASTGHIVVDECGAPTRMTGCQITTIPTPDGKLTPALIEPHLIGFGEQHHSQPQAIYISECSELGTIYTPDELKALTAFSHKYNMYVHMDGARLANACAALGVGLRELTYDCGIDVLSFGGTKNGLLLGECVVVFNDSMKPYAKFIRKQSAQLASKQRFLACQFTAYLENDLWLRNARHANDMAAMLHDELAKIPQITFTQKAESNQLFLTMPLEASKELHKQFEFFYWNESKGEIRFVTSFDTTKEDIDKLVAAIKSTLGHCK